MIKFTFYTIQMFGTAVAQVNWLNNNGRLDDRLIIERNITSDATKVAFRPSNL